MRGSAIALVTASVLLVGCSDTTSDPVAAPGSPATTPADPEPTATPTPEPPASFTMLMTGDVLLHDGFWTTARVDGNGRLDFKPIMAGMRPTVSRADLAICHMETPLAPPEGPFESYPIFSAPPQIAPALAWAGYDACTTASNHTVDQGFEGITRTIDTLDAAGIAHTGSYDQKSTAGEPLWLESNGARIALISATFGLNGLPLPEGAPWSVNLIDPQVIVAQAEAARAAGADVVVVALHWGDEYVHEPSAYQSDVADQITGSDAVDLVYGHHAHVVQPYDKVNDTWVLYGQGNALAQQDPAYPAMWEGNAALVRFEEAEDGTWQVAKVGSRPTYITPYGGADSLRYLDVTAALEEPQWAYLRDRLVAARDATRAVIASKGAEQESRTLWP